MSEQAFVPHSVADALQVAAVAAGRAPSIFNTQPWRWRQHGEQLELWADRTRMLASIDPVGRLMTISCGAALHHARVVLAVTGYRVDVCRLPAPSDRDLLARISVVAERPPDLDDLRYHHALRSRRTDRRPFAARAPVPDRAIEDIRRSAAAEGAQTHLLDDHQVAFLALAASGAAQIETKDDRYLADLAAWTNRPRERGDGLSAWTVVPQVPRRVPVRDFAGAGAARLPPGPGDDQYAAYMVLATPTDQPLDWLRAGEATSAALLTATADGLATAPVSDVTEVAGARTLLRGLIGKAGWPQLVIRMGVNEGASRVPASQRRQPDEVIEVDQD